MPKHRTHVAATAQTGAFHFAVKRQILVASRSAYQLRIPEAWWLTARVYHGMCSGPLTWLVFDIRAAALLILRPFFFCHQLGLIFIFGPWHSDGGPVRRRRRTRRGSRSAAGGRERVASCWESVFR